ncbi:MAG TPA: cell surface protein SprA [Flavisolibacter sp.]|nr:cell surface protein SprA [Flavisolibacter sp.]
MASYSTYKFSLVVATIVLSVLIFGTTNAYSQQQETRQDSIRYPLSDRRGDPYTYPNRNSFDFRDTGYIKRTVEYDPKTKQYYIVEKIGNQYYRSPATFTQEEFLRMQGQKDEQSYFRQRANLLSNLNRRNFKPKFGFSRDWVNRITGNGKVEIRPSGYVDLSAGYQGQHIKNPTLPERARRNGGFDFNQNAQLQVDAKIGDKINLPINYNTLANFDFENQLKLDYQGKDDEILKQFQLGNVNFSSKGTLIPGAQSLFGIKTQLQFGKLYVSTVLANQRSQRQSMGLQGGSATQSFSVRADEYEENRHFLMAQYFRKKYNAAMKDLPVVRSNVQILRVEVWVTNRTGATTETRDIVAFADMGEREPYSNLLTGFGDSLPRNNANDLFSNYLSTNPNTRNSTIVQQTLTGMGFRPVQDFEKTFARKLQPNDFYFNPQIGFLSLNQPLQPDEVVGVAYQYTYNGVVYQVGEFSQDIPPDSSGNSTKVLFLKLLKATSQRTNLPIWDLMMKNVYSIGFGQLERSDFRLDITYEEPSQGDKRYLPPTNVLPQYKGIPILQLDNLDRLNNQNDPQPDGLFDYIEGFTVLSSQSRIIFPVLEPFGHDLDYVYGNQADREAYLYYPLYDTIKAIAQNYTNLNRFKLVGRSKSAVNSEYQLGFNIPRGSVTVTAGGQILRENIDYEINYDLGTMRITNAAIIQAGLPVQVQYENNATFGLQQRNYLGLRLDYLVNRQLTVGASMVRLSERPFFTKQGYGEDPIRNTMYGVDFDYRNDFPRMTKWLNKLPFYSTRAMSSISAYGEAAVLDPGHASQIGKGGEGVIYIDDFEGTRSTVDLRFPLISWTLASVPYESPDGNMVEQFPEAKLNDDLASGYNRAKLAWYNIEPVLQERKNPNNPLKDNFLELSKPETRQILSTEIFPQRTNDLGQNLLTTFDLAYYPKERGPYNFRTTNIDANGRLLNPKEAWGGIMRNIDQTDFETSNIEFIEFWVQDPFINGRNPQGGELYFNLGTISEDVLKDGKRLYENGLPTPTQPNLPVDESAYGKVPRNPLQVTNAFSNEPNDRPFQDVGFDGLTDTAEQRKFQPYLNDLAATVGTNSPAYQKALADPSADNFKGYRDPSYDQQPAAGILQRYKDINNPHGNSPVATASDEFTNAFTLYPDQEELNRDNTLNEVEEYFQYRVELKPGMDPSTNSYITDVREVDVRLATGGSRREKWYLFRIPVKEPHAKVGNIPDLKSIRFIRMFLTEFEDTTVLRFAKLELVRNQWRKFTYETDNTGNYVPLPANDPTKMDVLSVNLEENDQRIPIVYRQSPGIERQQQISNNNVQLFLNEQSISLRINNLEKDKSRGVFKTMNLDLRQYGRLLMFVHVEDAVKPGTHIQDGDLNALVRIGNDFVSNYYEVKIPLKVTPWGARDSLIIWPAENNLDFDLGILTQLKTKRNSTGGSPSVYYSEQRDDGKTYAIMGNPNLGEVRGMFLGIENKSELPVNTEAWFNELRLSRLDEKGGWAALGRVDIRLADLGNVNFTTSMRSIGFGTLEQKVNERSRETFAQFDLSTNLDLGRLLPRSAGIQIPMYAGYSKTIASPEYDPYDLDLKLKDKINSASSKAIADSIRNDAVDETTIKTLNFTGVKKNKTNGKPNQPWDISNIDLNYSFTHQQRTNPIIELEDIKRTRAAIGYNYAPQPKFIEPLKKIFKSSSPWLALIRDFNFNYKPSLISVKADVFRQFGVQRNRNVGTSFKLPENFNKFFYFDRYYALRWDLTRSLTLDFNAVNNARIDEPFGHIDTKEKKDTVRKNFFKGGRNTHYHQEAVLSYNLPTSKLPILDWTTVRATYTAKYDWVAASLLATNLGNTLLNGQTRNVTADLDFDRLYSKWKFLRAVYSDAPPPPKPTTKDTSKNKAKNPNELPNVSGVGKFFVRMLTSVKRVGFQFTEDMGTLLPGYLDSTKILGMNLGSGNPGWKYVFGYQPDTSDINTLGNKGLLTRDALFNALIQQRYNQHISLTAQLSPIRDLNIDITLDKTYDKNYSELYKDIDGPDSLANGLKRHNPYATGSFSISYISYQTLFDEFDPNEISATFRQFEANRVLLSSRLKGENTYAQGNGQTADGYYEGYGRYAQDVLIPAFLAAYTKKDPMSIQLVKNSNPNLRANPFSKLIPKPNWNITYNGLTRFKGLEKIFTNFTVRHGYNSTLSMNSFTTALFFEDPLRVGFPSFRDSLTGNYVPYFLVPNLTIGEQFSPLIGLDMSFTNQLSARFEYKKSRQLSLSLVDYQLAENRSTEFSIGMDWRKRGVPFLQNVRIGKNGKKLDNDVTMRLDFSLRDDATANSKLDQNTAFGTAGQKVIRLAPSIDYVVNNRVNIKLYFDQSRTIPKIATTAPITTTRAGVQVRISLAQ